MCVRIELRTSVRELNRQLPGLRLARHDLPPANQSAASQPALILRDGGGGPLAEAARWGLVGSFLDLPPARPVLTLAYAGLASRPFYSRLLRGQRCLLPASAFVLAGEGGRGEVRVADAAGRPLMLAGVFDRHPRAGTTCALLSTAAAAATGAAGQTLPLLLGPAACAVWLAAGDEFPEDEFAAVLAEAPPPTLALTPLVPPEPSPQLAFAFA